MNRLVRLLVAVVTGVLLGFTAGFLFVPDPTGGGALIAGVALSIVIAAATYLKLGRAVSADPA